MGSPLALISALMFYFGWVRTQVEAHELGYDASVLRLSTTDYLLKSITILFPLVGGVLACAVVGQAGYSKFVRQAPPGPHRRERIGRLATVARALMALSIAVGVALYFVPATTSGAIPFSLTAAVLFALLQRSLLAELNADRWSRTEHVLVLLLLALLLFWDTERVARSYGQEYAYSIAADPTQFPAVTVYSAADLHIDAAGVQTNVFADGPTAYKYQYQGLRLMRRAGDEYILINVTWYRGEGRVIVLKDSADMRIEFLDRY